MANKNKTPLIRPLRKEGGTLYVFPSATEDIGLNINSRMNKVALSYYALLNIPTCEKFSDIIEEQSGKEDGADIFNKNRFQPGLINGRFTANSSNTIDGRTNNIGAWETAASLQNYAMNFETVLRNQSDYNYQAYKTVSERVFWKWLKETGAIRWEYVKDPKDDKPIGYYREVSDSSNYSRVVKCIGEITAGNSLSTEFGMFNEIYITVPSSYGESPIYFQIDEDENYKLGKVYTSQDLQSGLLEGRGDYVSSNIQDFQYTINTSWSDIMYITEEFEEGGHPGIVVKDSTNKTWYNYLYNNDINYPAYITDDGVNIYAETLPELNIDMQVSTAGESNTFLYKRSRLDAVSLIKNINTYKIILKNQSAAGGEFDNDLYKDYTNDTYIDLLNFDNLAIKFHKNIDSKFQFNAVLLYYTIYDANNSTALATNLFGILFLDGVNETLSTNDTVFSGGNMEFNFKNIEKRQSNESGFGTGYSFRVNIKTSSIYDNTDALIADNTTANSILTDNFNDVIYSLHNAITLLQGSVYVTQNIADKYNSVNAQLQSNDIELKKLREDLNTYLQYKYENIVADSIDSDVTASRTITSVSDITINANNGEDNTPVNFAFYRRDAYDNTKYILNSDPIFSVNKFRSNAKRLDANNLYSNNSWQIIEDLSDINDKNGWELNTNPSKQEDYNIIEALNVNTITKPLYTEEWNTDLNTYEYSNIENTIFEKEYIISPSSPLFTSGAESGRTLFKNNIPELPVKSSAVNYQKLIPIILSCLKHIIADLVAMGNIQDAVSNQLHNETQEILNAYLENANSQLTTLSSNVDNALTTINTYERILEAQEMSIADNVAANLLGQPQFVSQVTSGITDEFSGTNLNDVINTAINNRMDAYTEHIKDVVIRDISADLSIGKITENYNSILQEQVLLISNESREAIQNNLDIVTADISNNLNNLTHKYNQLIVDVSNLQRESSTYSTMITGLQNTVAEIDASLMTLSAEMMEASTGYMDGPSVNP